MQSGAASTSAQGFWSYWKQRQAAHTGRAFAREKPRGAEEE